jgi:hypothetical protein
MTPETAWFAALTPPHPASPTRGEEILQTPSSSATGNTRTARHSIYDIDRYEEHREYVGKSPGGCRKAGLAEAIA